MDPLNHLMHKLLLMIAELAVSYLYYPIMTGVSPLKWKRLSGGEALLISVPC